jgi:DNA topoisomerase-1
VSDLVVEYFSDVVNVNFTAEMENDLDKIANGNMEWLDTVRTFYETFEPQLKHAQNEMPEQKAELEKVGKICPECGQELVIRWGRYGKFISCSGFPACRHTEAFLEKTGVTCPKDGGNIVVRKSRRGRVFYGCENYPNCDFTSWKEPVKYACPSCKGMLVVLNKREYQCMDCESTFLQAEFSDVAEETA